MNVPRPCVYSSTPFLPAQLKCVALNLVPRCKVAIQDEERLGEGTGAELKAEAKQLLQKLITKHQDSDDKRYQKILNVARSVITSL
eukprot:m.1055599 g.1055599  ORF g.1055599 m.1055599 type:complete len:86 (+) comp24193_c0_seq3:111-368(+)